MIQFVVSGALPSLPVLRSRCLANPDALLEIARESGPANPATGELSDRFSLILHDLRMAGVWKRTNRQRLKRTEEMLCTHIAPEFRRGITFLDLGASDGITTVEAVCALQRAFGAEVRAYLTDVNLWLLRYHRGPLALGWQGNAKKPTRTAICWLGSICNWENFAGRCNSMREFRWFTRWPETSRRSP